MHKILIVDDEKDIVDLLQYNFENQNGFKTYVAYDGKEAFRKVYENKPHLILLDIMLPGINGFDICKELKENVLTADIPIIFISARSNETDALNGFDLGADDYITKPFSPRLVVSKVKSVLNRTYNNKNRIERREGYIRYKNLEVDLIEYTVKIDDEIIFFSKTELLLLYHLILNEGRVLSKKVLLNLVWGKIIYVQEHSVDFSIAGIKRKIGNYAAFIESVNGSGYKFNTNLIT
jgi:DNA-binding response OmpR family regulator